MKLKAQIASESARAKSIVASMVPDTVFDEARLSALASYNVLDTPPEAGFDGIVELARHACGCPVALVSLVDRNRQWFKARAGFSGHETDLDRSVCAHVLIEPDLLVIPDLTLDARTAANPLVVGEPHLRFYAGAPLRMDDGHVLGALCVIDSTPRPAGLTEPQKGALRNLAQQVMSQLELRRSLKQRDEFLAARRHAESEAADSQKKLQQSEAYWRSLFEKLSEGFIVGEVVRDNNGVIVDWRYVEVNAAWGRLLGVAPENARGRTVRDVFPDIENEWVDYFARVIETGESMTFTRQLSVNRRWYEGRAFKLSSERFAIIFVEVTERVRDEARRNGLLELGDRLRDLSSASEMAYAACTIVGRAVRAGRVGFGRLGETGDYFEVEPDWTTDGMASVAGRRNFSAYPEQLRTALIKGELVVVDDVQTDPRTAGDAASLLALNIRSLVNAPIRERGRVVALLFTHTPEPREWSAGAIAFLRNVADRLEVGVGRLHAEAQQRLLNQELSHRTKNMMAMVQGVARQTFKDGVEKDTVAVFTDRLHALSSAYSLMIEDSWAESQIMAVLRRALSELGQIERFDLDGPNLKLGPRATLSISLLIHELTTNAVKYGALSNESGRVSLTWTIQRESAGNVLALVWEETGGPPATAPVRTGFGSRLIGMGLIGTGGVVLDYAHTGFRAEMRASLAQVQQS